MESTETVDSKYIDKDWFCFTPNDSMESTETSKFGKFTNLGGMFHPQRLDGEY